MLLLLQSLTFAAKKLGITRFRPSGKELHVLTKEMVAYVTASRSFPSVLHDALVVRSCTRFAAGGLM